MHIDFATLSPTETYLTMTQVIVPRPIAWVLSENADGGLNLAPFSYFNALCSDPPLIGLSIGKKPDGSLKDTRINLQQRRHFVVHIAHTELLDALNASAKVLPAGVSEVEQLGLQTVAFEGFSLPRLADCRVALACELYAEIPLGQADYSLLVGKISSLYINDAIACFNEKGRLKVNALALQAIGRLGAGEYMQFGKLMELKSPA